jgi:hypothetical protein
MTDQVRYVEAEGRLRSTLAIAPNHPFVGDILVSREQVLARFGPVFSLEHIPQLAEEEVKAFLRFENNRHWTGLHRQGNRICADMDRLREVLVHLLDETQPLAERLNHAVNTVHGLGKGTVTAILLVAYPNRYGVWNNTSEAALRGLGVWPEFERGTSFGQRYEQVNAVLQALARELEIDLWTLDSILFLLGEGEPGETVTPPPEPPTSAVVTPVERRQAFGLERHLHDFLRDNWNETELGREWTLYAEQGDPEAGYEFPCDVGRIDLLARQRKGKDWLVIELKRDQSGDATVGQVLRYIGWVRRHLAQPGEAVRGMIIAGQADQGLLYAVSAVPDVDLRFYEVEFHLRNAPSPGE